MRFLWNKKTIWPKKLNKEESYLNSLLTMGEKLLADKNEKSRLAGIIDEFEKRFDNYHGRLEDYFLGQYSAIRKKYTLRYNESL
jgi:hypothetical protein